MICFTLVSLQVTALYGAAAKRIVPTCIKGLFDTADLCGVTQ